ncbi:MAG: hypothetical protein EOM91_13315 [Sphingobacteriia bacterium]|nr:hypothetical protein [Sphingobacteriia bacterium]NCC40891.1 hypothetical protein [Gammaproteobacteria bacterium]
MTSRSCSIAITLALFCASAVAAPAPEDELRAVLETHEQALSSHDMDTLMGLYAPGDEILVMGTTPPERWVGKAQIADAYQHFFADFDAGTVDRDCPWMQVAVSGGVGGWINGR